MLLLATEKYVLKHVIGIKQRLADISESRARLWSAIISHDRQIETIEKIVQATVHESEMKSAVESIQNLQARVAELEKQNANLAIALVGMKKYNRVAFETLAARVSALERAAVKKKGRK